MTRYPRPEAVLTQTLEPSQGAEEQSGLRRSLFSTLKHWFREPLMHFMILGVALFSIYSYIHRGRGGVELSKQIALTMGDLNQMALTFDSQWQRPPTPQEFNGMVEDKVREEVLYREGLAMGLDKDDTIVKRRMAQKMEFLAEDVGAAHEPTAAELNAWFKENSSQFTMPSRYTFRHVYFSSDRRGKNVRADAVKALKKIARLPEDSKLAVSQGDPFMFQDYYGDRTPEALAKDFGPRFAVAMEKTEPGSWQGPIESGYGWHLVFVDSVAPGRIPLFEEVESNVKNAWLADQKSRAWQKAYADMRAKYTVLLPALSAKEAAQVPAQNSSKKVFTPLFEGLQ